MDYNFVFPVIARFFDINRIAEKYYFVMLPSWTGMMVSDVLCFTSLSHPVACAACEPKDVAFLQGLNSNLHSVEVTANFFCDHRKFRPLLDVQKDIDVISVAAWGAYKRYPALLRSLAKLKTIRRGLKVAMVGYTSDLRVEDIIRESRYYGVHDCIEFHEDLSPEQVNHMYARSRVNILWSRREGTPRTPIEGMMANVPCIFRKGFNYGVHYDYMLSQNGRFATEAGLAESLNELIDRASELNPREWIMSHMTPQIAMERISTVLRGFATENGEPWTIDPVATCTYLNRQEYWNLQDRERFAADYKFLKSCRR